MNVTVEIQAQHRDAVSEGSGFTNRKDKYRDEALCRGGAGGFPFVKLHEASG